MDFYEVILQINKGDYNSFLYVHVKVSEVENSDEAVEKAYEYAEKMFGISEEEIGYEMVDVFSQ